MSDAGMSVIDLRRWREAEAEADAEARGRRRADAEERAELAAALDRALCDIGFLLLTGHGVDPDLAARVRSAAPRFFRLPDAAKAAYATPVGGGDGWSR
jgi:isopenicillin N synthase-like dioxygenase